jgi:hypothetical protein
MAKGLAGLSVAELRAELRRRSASVGRLQRKRTALAAKIARLDDEIERLGGTVNGHSGPRGGSRPRNETSLSGALSKLLGGKTMSVTDAAVAVRSAGYRTNSNNFRTQVNIALIKGPFKRVGRGEYTAK